jgi:hypothetical protein
VLPAETVAAAAAAALLRGPAAAAAAAAGAAQGQIQAVEAFHLLLALVLLAALHQLLQVQLLLVRRARP